MNRNNIHAVVMFVIAKKLLLTRIPSENFRSKIPKRPIESMFLIKACSGVIGKRLPKQPQFPELFPDTISIER
jgi:hypothetical protein